MILIKLNPELNHVDWVPWFAWHPVVTEGRKVVVFQHVLRKLEGISSKTVYRLNGESYE